MNHAEKFIETAKEICHAHGVCLERLKCKGQRTPNQLLAVREIHKAFQPFGAAFVAQGIGISPKGLERLLEQAREIQPERKRPTLHAWSDKKAFAPQKASEIMEKIVSLQ